MLYVWQHKKPVVIPALMPCLVEFKVPIEFPVLTALPAACRATLNRQLRLYYEWVEVTTWLMVVERWLSVHDVDHVSTSHCLSASVFLSAYVCLSVSVCMSACLCLTSVSLSVCLSASVSLSVSLFNPVCVCLCLISLLLLRDSYVRF